MRTLIFLSSFFIGLSSCSFYRTFAIENGQIANDSIVRIEFYLAHTISIPDSLKVPVFTIFDKNLIQELIGEINDANNPALMKGAGWDKIYIVKQNTVIKLNTNGKVIGTRGEGTFYHLKNEKLLQNYYKN